MEVSEYWQVLTLTKQDLEDLGYDTSQISDQDIGDIAKAVGEGYRDNDFLFQVDCVAKGFELPKRGNKEG
jgi:hypothetical protein